MLKIQPAGVKSSEVIPVRKLCYVLSGVLILAAALGVSGCAPNVSSQDIQGLLESVQGKEITIKQDDGTTTRITVNDASSAPTELVGSQVTVKVSDDNSAQSIQQRGEDSQFTGVIQSISSTSYTIGGRVFKVTQTTVLDSGLAVGVTARVEFITEADGTLLAIEIETDAPDNTTTANSPSGNITEDDFHFTGQITSLTSGAYIVGGKTFKVDSATMLDSGLAVGVTATVEYIQQADGSLKAVKIETGESGKGKGK